ncbi:MAG: TIM barrel protein [Chromatiales bacterium]|nr:TIM barrel protein [Chromatiales bacterium]
MPAVLRYHPAAMPRLSANLSYLFTERPFLDRFEAAARWGFRAIEHQFPYTEAPESAIRERLRAHDLHAVLFNLPPGNEGERGLGGLPGREAEFREGLDLALRYCRATGCPRLHAMWGVPDEETGLAESRATFVANLREAAPRAAEAGVTLLVEPLNPRDNPGYPLNRQADAHALVAEVGAPNVKVQFDLYHCQIVEGDVAPKLDRWVGGPDSNVGHIQIAGPPDRLEPDAGELNYAWLLPRIDALGYTGWVGCEYRPAAGTEAGLAWASRWGIRPPSAAGGDGSDA